MENLEISNKEIEKYLKHIEVESPMEKTILINHNDLEGNFYCINKQYIRIHFTKGIPEYLYNERKNEINQLFEQKIPRLVKEEEIKKIIEEETNLLQHIYKAKTPIIRHKIVKNIKEEILYKKNRINTGYKNLLLTTTPDIIIVRNGTIKAIIDIKMKKDKNQTTYFDTQKTLVNLMAIKKRKIPTIKTPITATVIATNEQTEKYKIIKIIENIKNIGKKTTKKALEKEKYKYIEIENPKTSIIFERLEMLTKEEIPLKTCPYKNITCHFREFCKELKVDV